MRWRSSRRFRRSSHGSDSRKAALGAGLGNAANSGDAQGQNRAVLDARLELLREAIGEQAGFIQIQADIVQLFASLGDDAGVTYALKRLVAYARAAAQTANELAALKAGGQ